MLDKIQNIVYNRGNFIKRSKKNGKKLKEW